MSPAADDRISVVGLGKLGLCLAAALAERGFSVLGSDLDPAVLDAVEAGRSPVVEPGLAELVARHAGGRLRVARSAAETIAGSDVTLVVVPTPSGPDGAFRDDIAAAAMRPLGEALRASEKPYHLFVLCSTVMPGAAEAVFLPLLERATGRRAGEGFGYCYNPEFIALGRVIEGFLRPDLVLIGEASPGDGARLEAVHHRLCLNEPRVARMSLVSAEVTKLALNAYVTMKISFANSLAGLCERLPGADVDAVSAALGADRRVSPYYLRAGPRFGGTCFPRDTVAYARLADSVGVQAELVRATERVNHLQDGLLLERVLDALGGAGGTVGLLGMSFVPGTPVVEESPGVHLADALLERGVRVVAWDPLALDAVRERFGGRVEAAASAGACLAAADVAVLTLRDEELAGAVEAHRPARPLTVVDCWRALDPARLAAGVRLSAIGRARPA